jgi:hypothetical protein
VLLRVLLRELVCGGRAQDNMGLLCCGECTTRLLCSGECAGEWALLGAALMRRRLEKKKTMRTAQQACYSPHNLHGWVQIK